MTRLLIAFWQSRLLRIEPDNQCICRPVGGCKRCTILAGRKWMVDSGRMEMQGVVGNIHITGKCYRGRGSTYWFESNLFTAV